MKWQKKEWPALTMYRSGQWKIWLEAESGAVFMWLGRRRFNRAFRSVKSAKDFAARMTAAIK